MEHEEELKSAYLDPANPGSYGGVNKLYQAIRDQGVTLNETKKFLETQESYVKHRDQRKKFPRNQTIVGGIDKQWQADLADMQTLSSQNDNNRYILTVIDCFSRFAWAVPVKTKSAKDMLLAFKELFQISHPRVPIKLHTDRGKEFYNTTIKAYLKEKEIELFSSSSDLKAAIVERFNRTLKTRMWRYFTANKTRRYIDVLKNLVHAYNNSVHRTIGMQPSKVSKRNETSVWRKLYGPSLLQGSQKNKKKLNLQKSDSVSIPRYRGDFVKGYTDKWTDEKFHVACVNQKGPRRVYKLEDFSGEPIEGIYYSQEVQKVRPPLDSPFRIERIVSKKSNGDCLIKWQGWPEKFNSWINKSDLKNYEQDAE